MRTRILPPKEPLPSQYGRHKRRPPASLKGWDRKRFEIKYAYITHLKHKAFLGILYASGCRISELIGTRDEGQLKRSLKRQDKKATLNDRPFRKSKAKGYTPVPALIKNQVKKEFINDELIILLVDVPTLKQRNQYETRNIAIPYEANKIFLAPFLEFVDRLGDEQVVFDVHRSVAYRWVRRYTGLFPHYLRHLRLSELAINYELTDLELRSFVGWKSSAMSATYTQHMNWKKLIRKQISKNEVRL